MTCQCASECPQHCDENGVCIDFDWAKLKSYTSTPYLMGDADINPFGGMSDEDLKTHCMSLENEIERNECCKQLERHGSDVKCDITGK